ncbi:hypothetical protein Scep_012683 [Stephania cephalantha]|uniref:GrpE protein homolog n=1 Tax=Stephania cephalantha TaxID=152367 RepID=A0AAP0JHK8_9MAGN
MFYSRVFAQISRTGFNHCRAAAASSRLQSVSSFSGSFRELRDPHVKVISLNNSLIDTLGARRFWFSSSASPEPTEKATNQPEESKSAGNETKTSNGDGEAAKDVGASSNSTTEAADKTEDSGPATKSEASTSDSVKRRRRGTKRTAFSDSDTEGDLSFDDLVKLVAEKEELLKTKHKEMEKMQDKVLRSYAEMENVMERARREAENSKKFAIQNFAKSLLDVADNLGRASSVVKESFSKIDTSNDTAGAVPLLKTLLEGVEMTEKQLAEVFRKFGVEKYEALNEPFDPNRHNAVFQLPDASKPAGTVAAVLKAGYMLHDRVIRPAEVGVTTGGSEEAERDSQS